MTPKRAVAWTLGAGLTAAWFASAAGVIGQPPRAPHIPPRLPQDAQADAIAFDVEAQAERLRKRLATAPAPQPVRNPFAFAPRPPVPSRSATRFVPPPAPLVPAAEFEPELTLIGVAEDGSGEKVVRTAMIVGEGQQLHLVRVGQAVGARYTVSAIGPEAVELKDTTTNRVRLIGLK
jgi:hypothetical protein